MLHPSTKDLTLGEKVPARLLCMAWACGLVSRAAYRFCGRSQPGYAVRAVVLVPPSTGSGFVFPYWTISFNSILTSSLNRRSH